MHVVGAFEAKNRLGQLLDRVERGEEVSITRHGKEVARLVPPAVGPDRQAAREAARRIRDRARELKAGPFDWDAWRALRDEGRA